MEEGTEWEHALKRNPDRQGGASGKWSSGQVAKWPSGRVKASRRLVSDRTPNPDTRTPRSSLLPSSALSALSALKMPSAPRSSRLRGERLYRAGNGAAGSVVNGASPRSRRAMSTKILGSSNACRCANSSAGLPTHHSLPSGPAAFSSPTI